MLEKLLLSPQERLPLSQQVERERERERGIINFPPDEVAQSASSKGERNVAQHNVTVLDTCWGRQALSQGIRYHEMGT